MISRRARDQSAMTPRDLYLLLPNKKAADRLARRSGHHRLIALRSHFLAKHVRQMRLPSTSLFNYHRAVLLHDIRAAFTLSFKPVAATKAHPLRLGRPIRVSSLSKSVSKSRRGKLITPVPAF